MRSLSARLARGEEAAFTELYDACADRLHRYLTLRLASRDVASDVLQATFLRAVRHRRRFGGVENPVAYLFQMARNEIVRTVGRQRGFEPLKGSGVASVAGSSQLDDSDAAVAALERLAADDRELVELKIFADLTFREIADVTGAPAPTVATRYRRALESLRPWLTKQLS